MDEIFLQIFEDNIIQGELNLTSAAKDCSQTCRDVFRSHLRRFQAHWNSMHTSKISDLEIDKYIKHYLKIEKDHI